MSNLMYQENLQFTMNQNLALKQDHQDPTSDFENQHEREEEHDVDVANQSAHSATSTSLSQSSESELTHNNQEHEHDENEVGDEEEADEEDAEEMNESAVDVPKNELSLYQQNCLAAAQMMQLICSTSSSLASASLTNGMQTESNMPQLHLTTNLSNEVSPGLAAGLLSLSENEKENIPICKYCNKIFANFSNLNHHISAIHLNQSKWVCSQCGKICSSKSNLKVHLRVHLRVKPYHCRWCAYSCMHHSSIRDHLAKVHPDKTHTPLQPGYLFNSQAVPEPEIFNSKGFNVHSYVNDTTSKRSLDYQHANTNDISSPEKRSVKKSKLNHEQQQQQQQQQQHSTTSQTKNVNTNSTQNNFNVPIVKKSPVKPEPVSAINAKSMYNSAFLNPSQYSPSQPAMNQMNSPMFANPNNPNSMSTLYNAYMARMLPFMYNPMQLQYALASQSNPQLQQQQQQQQPQQQSSRQQPTIQTPSTNQSFMSMLNQNLLQLNTQRPPYSPGLLSESGFFSSAFSSSSSNATNVNSSSASTSGSTSSDEHPTNSSRLSYSTSSRSSSLSPANKTSQDMNSFSSSFNNNSNKSALNDDSKRNESNSYPKPASSKKSLLSVDQMIGTSTPSNNNSNNKVNKETQTESSCLNCPYCSNKCI